CTAFTPGPAPRDGGVSRSNTGLPESAPADVQRLPVQVAPGPPAGGPLVRSGEYQFDNPGFDPFVEDAIAPAMTDLNTANFDDPSTTMDGTPFMRLAVGTPKPGTCWVELTSTALSSYGGSGVHTEPAGRRMSAHHLTLMCAWMAGGYRTCAWSGPGLDGHHPLFGILWVFPGDGRPINEAIMTVFSEKVFEAMTG